MDKIINKVNTILSKFDAESDGFTYDEIQRMEYVLVRDKLNRKRTQWVSCCTILLMADRFFKEWRKQA